MRSLFVLIAALSFHAAVVAQKAATMQVKVYLHNEKLNPNFQDCTKSFPTMRTIPKTKAVARAALDELLKGATKEEVAKEFWGFSPPETTGILKSITIKNRAAYVNFTNRMTEQMGTVTTSCGGGFFSMVENTLTQFPSIRKVYYAIEGDTNEFYEWVQVGECPYGKHCAKRNFK